MVSKMCVCVCLAQKRLGFRRYWQRCLLFLDLRSQARPQKFCSVWRGDGRWNMKRVWGSGLGFSLALNGCAFYLKRTEMIILCFYSKLPHNFWLMTASNSRKNKLLPSGGKIDMVWTAHFASDVADSGLQHLDCCDVKRTLINTTTRYLGWSTHGYWLNLMPLYAGPVLTQWF